MLIRPLKAFFVGMLILWFSSAALGCQPQEPPGKADVPLAMVDATALVKKTGTVVVIANARTSHSRKCLPKASAE